MHPREIPITKPSASELYIPKSLVRGDVDKISTQKQWLPTGKNPFSSKHSWAALDGKKKNSLRPSLMGRALEEHNYHHPTDEEIDTLQQIHEELKHTEKSMDTFITEFYIAAASFSAHANAQMKLLHTLKEQHQSSSESI